MGKNAAEDRTRESLKVTWVGFVINAVISLLKLAAGILGRSAAMVSDAVHSMSDLLSDVVVVIGVRLGARSIDSTHDYGHGKFETLSAVIIGLMVGGAGVGLFVSGIKSVIEAAGGTPVSAPGGIALIAAVVSIVSKEILYRYTLIRGRKLNSQPLIANAWHHRSDSFSSIGTMAGIAGSIFLGGKWTILDPAAAIIVALFVIRVGAQILYRGIQELLDASLSAEIEEEMAGIIKGTEGVAGLHKLRTRALGGYYALDVHVQVDGTLTVVQGHDIATNVEKALRERFGLGTFISIHIEPAIQSK